MGNITFDEKRAKEEINELRTIGRQLKKVRKEQFSESIKALGECWKGEASTAYRKKANVMKDKLDYTIADIDELADVMEIIVEQLKKAEEVNFESIMKERCSALVEVKQISSSGQLREF